jgi:dihydrofolate reductase
LSILVFENEKTRERFPFMVIHSFFSRFFSGFVYLRVALHKWYSNGAIEMRKLVLVVHTSLDGFVAGPNGELDGFDAGEENLQFVCKLTEDADTALFGRISYELLNSYWPTAKDLPSASPGQVAYSTWYNGAKKIVVSKTLQGQNEKNRTVMRDNVVDEIARVKASPGKNILIFGSPSVSQLLMQHNLIDDYWIFVNPSFFAKGIPVFKGLTSEIKLRLVTTKEFANGEVAVQYKVDRSS